MNYRGDALWSISIELSLYIVLAKFLFQLLLQMSL